MVSVEECCYINLLLTLSCPDVSMVREHQSVLLLVSGPCADAL